MKIHKLPEQPVALVNHPHSEKVFPHVQMEPPVFQFLPVASCLVTGYH